MNVIQKGENACGNSRKICPVSLIIATRNRPEMLEATLQSLAGSTVLPAEVIVIDQSDHPRARPVVTGLDDLSGTRLRYCWSQTRGLSRANNLGVALAAFDLLLFTHDDVLLDPDWVENLVTALSEGQPRRVVTGRILPGEAEVTGGFAPTLRTDERPARYLGRVGFDVLKPLNMGLSRSAFEHAGGFDERLGPGTPFPGAEDADLGFRLLEAGYEIAYVPAATLIHRAWRHGDEYLPLRWRYGLAQGAFFAKHLHRNDWHMLWRFLADGRRRARRFPRRLLQEPGRAWGDPLFLIANLVGAWRWRRHRGRDKRSLVGPNSTMYRSLYE